MQHFNYNVIFFAKNYCLLFAASKGLEVRSTEVYHP